MNIVSINFEGENKTLLSIFLNLLTEKGKKLTIIPALSVKGPGYLLLANYPKNHQSSDYFSIKHHIFFNKYNAQRQKSCLTSTRNRTHFLEQLNCDRQTVYSEALK